MEATTEYRYTIIIPHRDIPLLLKRCLASLPEREDIEVIVVDDNSREELRPDAYPDILPAHVRLLPTREGRGAGYARNVALDAARGEWILFADADDYFTPGFIGCLDAAADPDTDLLFFGAESVDGDGNPVPFHGSELSDALRLYREDRAAGELRLRYEFGPPWGKLIRRSLIERHAIRFEEVPRHNDTLFSLRVGLHAGRVKVLDTPLYRNVRRADSVTTAGREPLSLVLSNLGVAYRYDELYSRVGKSYRFGKLFEYYMRFYKFYSFPVIRGVLYDKGCPRMGRKLLEYIWMRISGQV